MTTVRKLVILGAAGRDFHDFNVVYRDDPKPEAAGAPAKPARPITPMPAADFSRSVTPNEVMLFRYSALTFNGHRIHYDAPYAKEVEGYPGLVVHGPLLATLMVDLVARELRSESVEAFEFTARQAVTLPATITINGKREGKTVSLWIENQGAAAVTGKASDPTATAGSAADVSIEDVEKQQGLWWYLLFAGLLLLAAEMFVSNRLSQEERFL